MDRSAILNVPFVSSMFILAAQRDDDPSRSFIKYREYLHANESRFPRSAYQLATSDWYMNPEYHECPHDAWLESLEIEEPSSGARHDKDGRDHCETVRCLP
jgi:hypothetical protein